MVIMGKTTRLDAINTMISNIGQAPVTRLDSGNPMVEMANNILEEVNRAVQSEGWSFNTERGYTFAPDSEGNITVPENVLSLDTTPFSEVDIIERGGRLYDKAAHTYTFTGAVDLDVVWLESFDDIPEVFKKYITIRAANIFAARTMASSEAVGFGQAEEMYARAAMIQHDCDQGDYNIFTGRDGSKRYIPFFPINVMIRRS